MTEVNLPSADGTFRPYVLGGPGRWTRPQGPLRSRVAYAAAHVVTLPLADNTPGAPAMLDWDTTLAYRHERSQDGARVYWTVLADTNLHSMRSAHQRLRR